MQHDFVGGPVAQDYGKVIGTPFKVFLLSGVVEKLDQATGKVMTEIIDLPGLIAAILQTRVLHPRKLSGDDLRFIRLALVMKSIDVAVLLDVSPEHYSRCEAGAKTLSASSEKIFRMYVFLEAACKHTAVQERLKKEQENAECDQEEAKEVLEAFKRVFLGMKIQHIYDPEDEMEFSFVRGGRRDDEDNDCGGEDGKWRKEPEQKAA